jgi:hypothetical protein
LKITNITSVSITINIGSARRNYWINESAILDRGKTNHLSFVANESISQSCQHFKHLFKMILNASSDAENTTIMPD